MSIDYEQLVTDPEVLAAAYTPNVTLSLEDNKQTVKPTLSKLTHLREKHNELRLIRDTINASNTISRSIALEVHNVTGKLFNKKLVEQEFTSFLSRQHLNTVLEHLSLDITETEVLADAEITSITSRITEYLATATPELESLLESITHVATEISNNGILLVDNIYVGDSVKFYNVVLEPIATVAPYGLSSLNSALSSIGKRAITIMTDDITKDHSNVSLLNIFSFFKDGNIAVRINTIKNIAESNITQLKSLIEAKEASTTADYLENHTSTLESVFEDTIGIIKSLNDLLNFLDVIPETLEQLRVLKYGN